MRVFLFSASVLCFAIGCLVLFGAESAIHEIEGGVLVLIAATLLSAAAIVEALKPLKKIEESLIQLAVKADTQADILDGINTAVSKGAELAPPPPGHEKYYVAIDGKAVGPYDIPEMRALVKKGSIDVNMKIAKVGDKTWQPVSAIL